MSRPRSYEGIMRRTSEGERYVEGVDVMQMLGGSRRKAASQMARRAPDPLEEIVFHAHAPAEQVFRQMPMQQLGAHLEGLDIDSPETLTPLQRVAARELERKLFQHNMPGETMSPEVFRREVAAKEIRRLRESMSRGDDGGDIIL